MNFTWWVNRKDPPASNVFQGGFLGLDNIGVFDRSAPLPTGGHLEQADGTAWMALFCQNMLEIALELASHDPSYDDMAAQVPRALPLDRRRDGPGRRRRHRDVGRGGRLLLRRARGCPTAAPTRLKVRSMVGLLPLCASTIIEPRQARRLPRLRRAVRRFLRRTARSCVANIPIRAGRASRAATCCRCSTSASFAACWRRMLDETEFLSPLRHPVSVQLPPRASVRVRRRRPGVPVATCRPSPTPGMFGGNSNWRGPIWIPVNCCSSGRSGPALLLRRRIQGRVPDRLRQLHDTRSRSRTRSRGA